MKIKLLLVLVALSAIIFSGCGPKIDPADILAFTKPHQIDVNADTYKIQPPDEIQIICTKIPEVHEVMQRVRPDGKVTFETLGEFDVAGKTTGEVAEMIKEKALTLYALSGDYPIDVRVATFASNYYYVLGQVNYPGPRLVTGRDSALHALAVAQPTVLGWTEKVRIIRPSYDPENTEPKMFEINLVEISKTGDISKDVLLQQGDIVFVPPTVLAAIAMKVEEAVRPIGRAFSTVNVVQGP